MHGRLNKAVIHYSPLCGMWWPVIRKINIDIEKLKLPQTHQPKDTGTLTLRKNSLRCFKKTDVLDNGGLIILTNPLAKTPSREPIYPTCSKQIWNMRSCEAATKRHCLHTPWCDLPWVRNNICTKSNFGSPNWWSNYAYVPGHLGGILSLFSRCAPESVRDR